MKSFGFGICRQWDFNVGQKPRANHQNNDCPERENF
jgi:hypothetical protein